MQSDYMPATIAVRKLHEKYSSKGNEVYFGFVYSEKAFDRVCRK